jgi:hypothetical protein
MRRPYPISSDRLRSSPARSTPGLPAGMHNGLRISLVALQEEIRLPAQLPNHRGAVAVRRLKLLRVEESVAPDSLPPGRPARPALRKTAIHKRLATGANRGQPSHHAELPELECRLDGKLVRLKSVRELVTDEAGHFYDVNGEQLRALGELVRDEHGRVFEVRPTSDTAAIESTNENSDASSGTQTKSAAASQIDGNQDNTQLKPVRSQTRSNEPSPGYRKIACEPGLYLKFPWGRIKSELSGQIRHPEAIPDNAEIECYAQIYEAQRTLAAAQLAAAELGDGSLHSELRPLTRAKAEILGVPQLFRTTRHPFETRASTRQLYPGQRVYRLWPVFDPTALRVENASQSAAASKEQEAEPGRQVPQEYLNPLQFDHSREEVLYDMTGIFGTQPVQAGALARWFVVYPLRLLKMLVVLLAVARRLRKWRAMLQGKSLDEQLWRVTPPRSFSYHPALRRWAEETLTRAGYDAARMLVEWEIYWRRKGV